jgi:hypothetical protein
MFTTLKSLTAILLLTVSHATFAERLYPLYPGAVAEEPAKVRDVREWQLALSKNRKVDGDWIFDDYQNITGSLESVTYRIFTSKRLLEISRFYQTYAETGDNKKLLFSCKGRSCGSSNEWANRYFGVRELYGPDVNQRYWAMQFDDAYLALYLIERGNGRIYLQAETLRINADKQPKQNPSK